MDYPLDMKLPEPGIGFAVANDETEHKALTVMGYSPAWVETQDEAGHTLESVRATLDAAGIAYDKRLGLAKLIELLPA